MKNLLTLTVFDPDGFRAGASRPAHATRCASARPRRRRATFRPLPAGEWTVQIDTHMIMPGEPVRYWLDVTIGEGAEATVPAPAPVIFAPPHCHTAARVVYTGDLHSHSNHSDARAPRAELVDSTRAGLDFVFLTDHDTISGLPEMDASTTPSSRPAAWS